MAFHLDYQTIPGLVANSTGLATSQYKVVKLASTAGQVVLNATSVFQNSTVQNFVGVLQNAPAAGEAAEVAFFGVAKLKVGTAIAIGEYVGCDSNSLGADAGQGTDNTDYVARALEAATAANDIITVFVIPGGARY